MRHVVTVLATGYSAVTHTRSRCHEAAGCDAAAFSNFSALAAAAACALCSTAARRAAAAASRAGRSLSCVFESESVGLRGLPRQPLAPRALAGGVVGRARGCPR